MDIKRIWTHETFDNSKVYSQSEIRLDCESESCENFEHVIQQNFIDEANEIIENGVGYLPESHSRNSASKEGTNCLPCRANAFDPHDSKIKECIDGTGAGNIVQCTAGERCLTYFQINDMQPPGIGAFYIVQKQCGEFGDHLTVNDSNL